MTVLLHANFIYFLYKGHKTVYSANRFIIIPRASLPNSNPVPVTAIPSCFTDSHRPSERMQIWYFSMIHTTLSHPQPILIHCHPLRLPFHSHVTSAVHRLWQFPLPVPPTRHNSCLNNKHSSALLSSSLQQLTCALCSRKLKYLK